MSAMENRREYAKLCWKSARQHWLMSILGSAFIFYSGVQTFSQNLDWGPVGHLSERLPKLPKLPLPWAISIALAILVFILIEGGWRLRNEETEKHRKELLERDFTIASLLSTEKAPRIHLSYAYSIKGWRTLANLSTAEVIRQMSDQVHIFNDSEQVAFNVEIQPICHDKFMAKFETYPQLLPHGNYYLQPTLYENDIERPVPWNKAFARMFVGILATAKPVPPEIIASMRFLAAVDRKASNETSAEPEPDWRTPEEGFVPVFVHYHDSSGKKKFISKCEIHYNRNDCTIRTRQLGIEAVRDD
jgi:hypothetical protein